jgi:S-DNA-T family DNA segregation ATPase FtsK/SpoIIIE
VSGEVYEPRDHESVEVGDQARDLGVPVDSPDRAGDIEVVPVEPVRYGGPVDPPDEPRTLYGTITASQNHDRPPLVAAWLRNHDQRIQVAKQAASLAGYTAAKHALRTPKYTGRVAWRAPKGLFRVGVSFVNWARDAENFRVRQMPANKGDYEGWQKIKRESNARHRLYIFWLVLAGLAAAAMALWFLAPTYVLVLVGVAVAGVLAVVGSNPGEPLIDRTRIGPKFVRLTGEMVREALCNIGLASIKEPRQLSFPEAHGGVKKDGPGWTAIVDLPHGVEAIEVIQRRGKLSSALRLPYDQVWPEKGPGHDGQLALWVSRYPVSQMGRARWELASPKAQTCLFEPFPFGVDQRMSPVNVTLFQRNFLIGGQPGSGKTFAGRSLVGGALLDPTSEIWLAAYKPAEDFHDMAEFCTRYICGIDHVAIMQGEEMIADGLAEVRRRQTLLGRLKRDGKIAEGRTDPNLARAGVGLHPLILVFDEVHELFMESEKAVEDMVRLIKQGRSAFVTVILITQVADKDSVPPRITRCVSSRWCLSVLDQIANDQIMGTGAYKRGQTGTMFRPGVDAGWGFTTGMADGLSAPVRAYYPDERELKTLMARIAQVRGIGTNITGTQADRRDVLDDVLHVFATFGRRGIHWQTLAELLADQFPEAYEGISAEAVSALVRDKGVPTEQVKVDGVNQWGCKKVAVEAAVQKALEAGK